MKACKVKLIFRRIFLYGEQLFSKTTREKKKKTPNNYLRKEIDSHYLVAFLSKVNPKKILKVYVKCGEQREEEEEEEREEKG